MTVLVATTAMFSSVAVASAHNLGDLVWKDTNNNGVVDAGEPGIGGVTVMLRNTETGATQSTVTEDSGYYHFWDLGPGDFDVWIPLPSQPLAGCVSSTGSPGAASGPYEPAPSANDKSRNNQDHGQTASDGSAIVLSEPVQLRSQPADLQVNDTVDFGVFCPASLGDFVWNDLDRDGFQDAGEPGIPGVAVSLLNGSGVTIATTATGASGNYRFDNLPAGTYSVRFATPAGMVPTASLGAVTDATNSDASTTTGLTNPVTLIEREHNPNIDAGFYVPPSVTVVTTPPPPRVVGTGRPAPKPTLAIRKSGPAKAKAGSIITYTIRVTNPSKAVARGVTVQDLLPAGLTVVLKQKAKAPKAALKKGQLNWSLGALAPGASRTINVTVRVGSNVTGRVSNTATVRGSNVAGVKRAIASTLISAIAPQAPSVTG